MSGHGFPNAFQISNLNKDSTATLRKTTYLHTIRWITVENSWSIIRNPLNAHFHEKWLEEKVGGKTKAIEILRLQISNVFKFNILLHKWRLLDRRLPNLNLWYDFFHVPFSPSANHFGSFNGRLLMFLTNRLKLSHWKRENAVSDGATNSDSNSVVEKKGKELVTPNKKYTCVDDWSKGIH